ncbi:hypothetical protein Tco_1534428 [Tanacetum coccineum]
MDGRMVSHSNDESMKKVEYSMKEIHEVRSSMNMMYIGDLLSKLGECSCSCVDGASWSIDVDTGESAISTTLNAATTGIGETTMVGGLKYSSNMGWNKRSQSFLFGGLQGC